MANLELLKPKVRELAEKLISECEKIGYKINITQSLRTIEEQDALYAQGRTKPGNIVTKAKGGYSLHNFGVAFDICPIVNGKAAWNDTELFKKIGAIGSRIGLEWGGTWASFEDLPHFQFLAGYILADFRNSKIDWNKFEIVAAPSKSDPATLKVIAQDGLNVRNGPAIMQIKIGKLNYGEIITPIEISNDWIKINYKNQFGWVNKSYLA
ncbi:MAG: M15 family metallopeptidase [bacterium]|nr:M15 family metallopeptidase [bacterium]